MIISMPLIGGSLVKAVDDGGFSVQVTPSSLIATIEPGKKSTLELRINNSGSKTETFKMGLSSFSINETTGNVDLGNEEPKDIASFVSFDQPEFSIEPGQWINQRVFIDTPVDAGFSYSFAIMVLRSEKIIPQNGGASLQGSVAVFTLLNVNRSDAVRKIEVLEFTSKQKVYEYLPTEFSITIKNSGNTIVAPKGNVFISRKAGDVNPIDVLQVNQSGGYTLPDTSRKLNMEWNNGFPAYEQVNGVPKLVWDYSNLSKLRIGKYTAKAIVIYDDGERDVPIEAIVSFWVIPWKIIGGLLLLLTLVFVGVFTTIKKSSSLFKRKPKKAKENIKE